jgi:hypothetical protein
LKGGNMSEQTENKSASENPDNGNIVQTTSYIDRADSVAKRMEDANKKAEELLKRNEEILARLRLSGHTEAGKSSTVNEETPSEYAKRILSGKKK